MSTEVSYTMINNSDRNIVAVIATYRNSFAIWNCMRQHIDLMLQAGSNVFIYISNLENAEYIQEEYVPCIIHYNSKRDLKIKIQKQNVNTIWYSDVVSTLKYGRLGTHSRVLTWIQGTIPDESFLRYKSYLKKWILETIEYFAFKFADGFVLVSDSMRDYYEKKYGFQFKNYIVIPCLSDFHDYIPAGKRVENSYVYIGGMSEWQCFDRIVELYAQIRTRGSVFHVITMEKEKAEQIILSKLGDKNNISIYSITDRQRIPEILSTFQFGFLIREESPVNYVSSPIKFLEYLSCGVNVIMTDTIPAYSKLVMANKIGTVVPYGLSEGIAINNFSPNARQVYLDNFDKEHFIAAYKSILN